MHELNKQKSGSETIRPSFVERYSFSLQREAHDILKLQCADNEQ